MSKKLHQNQEIYDGVLLNENAVTGMVIMDCDGAPMRCYGHDLDGQPKWRGRLCYYPGWAAEGAPWTVLHIPETVEEADAAMQFAAVKLKRELTNKANERVLL